MTPCGTVLAVPWLTRVGTYREEAGAVAVRPPVDVEFHVRLLATGRNEPARGTLADVVCLALTAVVAATARPGVHVRNANAGWYRVAVAVAYARIDAVTDTMYAASMASMSGAASSLLSGPSCMPSLSSDAMPWVMAHICMASSTG